MENRGYITITGLENKDEQPIVSVKIENGNVWMTKHELARLFGVFVQTIDANVRSIFKSRLLYDGDVTITEKQDHSIFTYYNLEAIIFLSFRINTYCTKLFREWVLNSLCEYKRLQEKKPEVLVVFYHDTVIWCKDRIFRRKKSLARRIFGQGSLFTGFYAHQL